MPFLLIDLSSSWLEPGHCGGSSSSYLVFWEWPSGCKLGTMSRWKSFLDLWLFSKIFIVLPQIYQFNTTPIYYPSFLGSWVWAWLTRVLCTRSYKVANKLSVKLLGLLSTSISGLCHVAIFIVHNMAFSFFFFLHVII